MRWIFAQLHDGDLRDMMFSTLFVTRSLSTTPREGELGPPFECFWTHLRNVLTAPDIADHHYDFFTQEAALYSRYGARAAPKSCMMRTCFQKQVNSL
jgi:hypothetical protein